MENNRIPRSKRVRGFNSLPYFLLEKVLRCLTLSEIMIAIKISKLFSTAIKECTFFAPFSKMLKKDFNHSFEDLTKNEAKLLKKLKKQYEINPQDSLLIFSAMFLKSFPKNPSRDQNVAFISENE
jgi:hypothetical protein